MTAFQEGDRVYIRSGRFPGVHGTVVSVSPGGSPIGNIHVKWDNREATEWAWPSELAPLDAVTLLAGLAE